MGDRMVKAIIQDAASGNWNIPEFQREFEWKHEQVAMLCKSLYEDLPIGMFTVWNTQSYNEPQTPPPTGKKPLWIVDGQQRITAFCILTGSKPNWMGNTEWEDAFNKKRIFLNINQDGEATLGRPTRKASLKIPLDEFIHKEPGEAQRYVQGKCTESSVEKSQEGSDLAVKALRILDNIIPVAEVGEEKAVEDIAELYRRLNQQGTRLRQAQIMLAYVAQYNPGWVRNEFYPFLQDLSSRDDWELDPAHVLQVATILAEGKARVGLATIPEMWQSHIKQIWPNLKGAIDTSVLNLWDRGISDQDMVPSSYTLITLFAMQAKFMEQSSYNFDRVFRWFILANLSGRYGDAPLETLTTDGHAIYQASSPDEALENLPIDWAKENLSTFLGEKFRDNSSQALLLHTLLWSAQAKDWIEGLSIPALTQAPKSLEPHWHHIVPKAWGRRNGFENCDKTANVTRLCGQTNVRKLRSVPPWEYVPKFNISKEALIQHLIPDKYAEKFIKGQPLSNSEFQGFLKEREDLIVQKGAPLLGI
jgi:hypothetical protein